MQYKMSKRARKKLEKIQGDDKLDDLTKQELVSNLTKRQKTDQTQSKFWIEGEKQITSENKPSALWDENERNFLEDVTMNLIEDDEILTNTKGKTVMKWDKTKKRYTLQKVDRDGRVMSEGRGAKQQKNEAGQKIKKSDERKDVYKRWTQRTHLKL